MSAIEQGLLTYDDLAARWHVCRRQAKRVAVSLGLSPLRLGHKTVLFRPADVLAKEAKRSGARGL